MNRNRLLLAIAIVLGVLAVNGVLSFRSTQRLIENERGVARTHATIAELSATLAAVTDAETGQRGYQITGQEAFLEPYRNAAGALALHRTNLRQLLDGAAPQAARLAELDRRVGARLAHLERTIALRRARGRPAADTAIASGEGRVLMDSVRALVGRMRAAETGSLRMMEAASAEAATFARVTFGLTSAIALVLIGLAYGLVRRDVRRRAATARALEQANEALEARVLERTAALEGEVADRRAAQNRLRTLAAELERSNRELQDFAYVASHDLQEPLRKIRMFADLLAEEQGPRLDADARHSIARMQDAAGRMSRLINDLLTFSRVASRARPAEPVDLAPIVADVLADLAVAIEELGGAVDVGALPVVYADAVQMRQLFQNLVGNALKFQRPGAQARVHVREAAAPEGWCCVEVHDNGIGFDEKYLDRIFTPFQRLHGRSEYAGTGIGLAVCRKIAERHGGAITARSEPGAGATFSVVLPGTSAAVREAGVRAQEAAEAEAGAR